ncbi:MAG TPA: aspartate-semialdehyde dehydrogenase [Halanaerobiaceae bacterium]|jgi:aspartate-semialdehyde dehydrogenase|nr:aspartate-semialdehyde dehydrogenase [Halanaerobiaceae bacterium]HOA41056.1 aspartate-semialdehyde dehydrogenase [Halanaerobiales bacterium]HPZ63191.1 aspartate-semialdehyde dehydrogenase [Halanaerobiales bacterium]HQD04277.1 aspartate-semialdehyde dehydrogenase [Halanaerobiales bacterium]
MNKIKVGVIGATGMVGQNYLRLLADHPWFEVTYVAASPRSAGRRYEEAVAGRWLMTTPLPDQFKDLIVGDAGDINSAKGKCSVIFSAVSLDKEKVKELELAYAAEGFAVVSNNSAHRHTENVPMLIPEINHSHADIIPAQRKHYGWDKGLLAVKPNCSLQSYLTPIHALREKGYQIDRIIITTMQAISGAGYPGPATYDLLDNVVPYIGGEEEKTELEPLKIFGTIKEGKFIYDQSIQISAHCNRVPVIDGHTACVSMGFKGKRPEINEIVEIWENFTSLPQLLDLPSAPRQPIIVRHEVDRPQPRRDRDMDKAMAVTVGRLRECNVFDYRFVGLSHNTVRGAAGGAILMAELLTAKEYIK